MSLIHVTINVQNMTCTACENKLERKLTSLSGVMSVKAKFANSKVSITFDDSLITLQDIHTAIEQAGYEVINNIAVPKKKSDTLIYAGIAILLFAAFYLLSRFGVFSMIPQVDATMGFAALFVVGLITSVHCTAMCGGINLAQCMTYRASGGTHAALPALLYNLGRVISYTAVGAIAGGIGKAIPLTGHLKGFIALAAGLYMVIMGVVMLDLFPFLRKIIPHMPKSIAKLLHGNRNYTPFAVGLLNGLMPCGPLQAMQIYAFGTGSIAKGALSMFFFSLGTVPLMFGLGAVSTLLKKKHTIKVMKIGALLVIVLGFGMFANGLALSGVTVRSLFTQKANDTPNTAAVSDKVQEITTTLGRTYSPITVQKGIPVRWTIKADAVNINGCNNELVIPEYNVRKKLAAGDNIIEFTPEEAGTFPYSCWMGMIRSTVTVVEELKQSKKKSVTAKTPHVSTESIVFADVVGDIQKVASKFDQNGFSPAIIVMQRNLETEWMFQGENIAGKSLVFPLYQTEIPLVNGENPLQFMPYIDFTFASTDNEFYGFVKVVDDIKTADRDKILEEVKKYKPNPDNFVIPQTTAGASCH